MADRSSPAKRKKRYYPKDFASTDPRIKERDTLPKMLPGTVHAQMVRCGQAGCKCERGELHGPYYYRFYREGGQLRKTYVKRSEVDGVRSKCRAWQKQRTREKRERDRIRRLMGWGTAYHRQLLAALKSIIMETKLDDKN